MMHQKVRSIVFILCMLFSSLLFSAVLEHTLIKTSRGLIAVENVRIGDELIGYDTIAKQCTSVAVTNITTCAVNTVTIITTDKGDLSALPNQLLYDPVTSKWMQAINITEIGTLLDSQLNQCACSKKETTVISPITAYRITTSSPHTFFITDQEVLTHNFVPVISGFDPNPNDDKNSSFVERISNTMTKTEFFRKMKKRYEHWRDGIYRRINKKNGLDKNAEYLKWDHLHSDVEAYGADRMHIGSIDPHTLKLYKNAIPGREL